MSDFDLTEWVNSDEDGSVSAGVPVVRKNALSEQAIAALNFCEQTYWETGLLPTPEAVSEELGISPATCRKYFQDETFRTQIAARGMDAEQLVYPGKLISQTKALSPKQILVANMMLNLHDKRSEREKLQQVGVSSQQYHAWLRQPQFQEFLRKRGEALFSASDFEAYKSLVRNVKGGDNKSLELFFRMRGIYRPEVSINLNIESVLLRIIEIISTHVKDPHILNAIANDIDNVIDAEEAS